MYTVMAQLTGVPVSFLFGGPESIQVYSQILRSAHKRNVVLPSSTDADRHDSSAKIIGERFKQSLWSRAVTLDSVSLLRSLMVADNTSYCTMVNAEEVSDREGGMKFVKSEEYKEILPEIIEEIIEVKKDVENRLKECVDHIQMGLLNCHLRALTKVAKDVVYEWLYRFHL